MRIGVCISAALVSAMLAGQAIAVGQQQDKPKKDPSQQVICKDDTYVGSHIPSRVCKTRAEWDEAEKQSQHYLDTARMLPVQPPKPTGG